ncbi:hypothetical protein IF1G_07465 [Cordyceps javanica]|uniref:Uncharacterized protein n=1 Tax=Cordyceps javanica TaxID=43265 RepID=A0A545UW85_9HYPO|nr:hypothetical protein IF1G_07465 [Cordyceps javanica]TQW04520.1 hypothetical protein IF2G_07749 [Cordyceps javanica]
MSSTLDHVAFMAPRPHQEPSTTHSSAVSAAPPAPMGTTLPPLGSAPINKLPAVSNARAPEPPAPESAKVTELPKPAVSEPKPASSLAGASLPSISNLDAPPQPPAEPAGDAPKSAAATASGSSGITAPAPDKPEATAPAPAPATATLAAPSLPKPVEIKSVPDTPVNTGTPAGGTPRPVLDISQEPIQKSEPEAVTKPAPTSAQDARKPESSLNGETEKPAPAAPAPTSAAAPITAPITSGPPAPTGQKRKFEDDAETPRIEAAHADKKAKAEESAKSDANGITEAAAAAADVATPTPAPASAPAPKKAGRPKKSKTPAPVGKTQRKTRSQGPVEGAP